MHDQCYGGSRVMLAHLRAILLANKTSAQTRSSDILWLVSENTIVSLDWVSSNSLCLKGLAEPLPPAELEILEGFNIKIFDCQIDSRGESIDKRRDLLITPVSQVISRIRELSICDTNRFAYYTQIN